MSTIVDLKKPMMPMATAVWLIDNTTLTFEQIGAFTEIHAVEIQSIADGSVGKGIVGRSPIDEGILSKEEIEKGEAAAEKGNAYTLQAQASKLPPIKTRSKGPKYTPVAKRGDKPDAIAYIVKNHPEISDAQICKLVGTTKPTIAAIRDRTHANMVNIKPRNPADIGICTYKELETASHKGLRAQGKDPEEEARKKAEAAEAERKAQEEEDAKGSDDSGAGFDFSNFMNS